MSPTPPVPDTPSSPTDVYYPASEPMPETPLHMMAVAILLVMLREWFRHKPDVYVIGNVFWYYKQGDPRVRKAPDIMMAKGVDPTTPRRVWLDWVEGARPSFVLEVVSEDSIQKDLGDKRETYELLGVREYFLFDPDEIGLPEPLMGFRLINGVYEELQIAGDGTIASSELGLRLKADGDLVALFSMRSGERLAEPARMADLLAETRMELEELTRAQEESEREVAEAEKRAEGERREKERERELRLKEQQEKEDERRLRLKAQQEKEKEREEKENERRLRLKEQEEKENERRLRLKEQEEKENERRLRLKEQQEKENEQRLRLKAQQEKEKEREEKENERRLREVAQREIERLRQLLAEREEDGSPPTS